MADMFDPYKPKTPETPGLSDSFCVLELDTNEDETKVSQHEEDPARELDLAFAMDCTGSMSSQISQATENIRRIVDEIVQSENVNIRLALVEYRDHPPQDKSFVTKMHDFTPQVHVMKEWLEGCSAAGGGDAPEAVADALNDLVHLSWRPNATRVAILVSDAPPHGISSSGDGFPNGCPLGHDPLERARKLAALSVSVYTVGCNVYGETQNFLMAVSHMTGGQFVPLSHANLLAKAIVSGAKEEINLQDLMQDIDHEVENELNSLGENIQACKEEVVKNVFEKLKARNVTTTQMQGVSTGGAMQQMQGPTSEAKSIGRMGNLKEYRECHKKISRPVSKSRRSATMACLGGPPMLVPCSAPIPEMKDFVTTKATITYDQASRMVSRNIAKNNLETKFK